MTSRTFKITAVVLVLAAAGIIGVILMARSGQGTLSVLRTKDTKQPAPTQKSEPYSVTMSPVGTVRFERPPERIVTQDANYNDMLVAVSRDDKLTTTGYQNNFFDGFYKQLPGVKVSIDPQKLTYLSAGTGGLFDKELLYKLRPDIFHIDPLQLATSRGWSRADVDEIARNVAPFFANRYSRENIYPGKEPYEFYGVWELADKVAQVYRRPKRITLLKEIGDKLVRDIGAKLPAVEKRPKVGLIYYGNGRITPYSMQHGGFGQAQYMAVGAQDAFATAKFATYGDAGGRGATLDLEGLLSLNPDVLIMSLAIYGTPGSGQGARAAYEQFLKLKDDPLGQRLAAFQKGRVYPGGTPLQGPIFYLFQIEMAAKQIYPDIFGAYHDSQQYPPQEQLFDRERVAKILSGAENDDHASH
jgi:ABC-type Fe3+-hydroxamate transport system substrate-binding protein